MVRIVPKNNAGGQYGCLYLIMALAIFATMFFFLATGRVTK